MPKGRTTRPRDTNSKRSRVEPVFLWLQQNGGPNWHEQWLKLAEGIRSTSSPGQVGSIKCRVEEEVPPSPTRLAWLIRNAERLAPLDGRKWREYQRRVVENPAKERALALLDAGKTAGVPKSLILEGPSHADCLIECERMIIWIEGKRNDWLAPSTTWDVTRDQLARNLEAAWLLSSRTNPHKDYCLIICHEHPLKHHESQLVEGYRSGRWSAGWPHLPDKIRTDFAERIGTLTWRHILDQWPALAEVKELSDVAASSSA